MHQINKIDYAFYNALTFVEVINIHRLNDLPLATLFS